MSIFTTLRYPAALPDALRPKPGGLHPQQLLVYEAFQRVPRQPTVTRSPAGPSGMPGPSGVPPTPSSPASPAMTGVQGPVPGGAGPGGPGGRGVNPKVVELTLEQALAAWQGAIGRLDMAIGGLLAAHRRQGGPEPTLHTANRDQELSAALQEVCAFCLRRGGFGSGRSGWISENAMIPVPILCVFSDSIFDGSGSASSSRQC